MKREINSFHNLKKQVTTIVNSYSIHAKKIRLFCFSKEQGPFFFAKIRTIFTSSKYFW